LKRGNLHTGWILTKVNESHTGKKAITRLMDMTLGMAVDMRRKYLEGDEDKDALMA
jgi:hypothetical protein